MQVTKITDMPTAKPVTEQKILSQKELQNEYDYLQCKKNLQKILDAGLITQEEFHKIDQLNRKSFSILYASLMS